VSEFEQMVDGALRDPLAAARAHASDGGRVIGYVGAEMPVELIIAAKAFPLRLPSFAQGSAAAADRYLESSFMPDVRSICEQYLQGAFDFLQAIVFPRSNDSAQRLYYYFCELRTRGLSAGPEPLIFDLAKIPRDTSRAHSRVAIKKLASHIGAREQDLPGAIARRNRRRELFAAAATARIDAITSCRGSAMDRLFRAADFCDSEKFDAGFGVHLQQAGSPPVRPRVLLAGTPPPDDRLHLAVEAGGGNVVAEFGEHASRSVALPLIATDGSFAAIADHYQTSQIGQRAFVNRAAAIVDLAKAAKIGGVVTWLLEQEDVLIWDLPAQAAALSEAGVASLTLSRRRWDDRDGALDEIAQFTRTLGKSS
jgi:benzoyl-CoA reductase/2-hydroxyglutaryl-CoA dehydratase subunit BcrC/BadD/HgdB